MKIIFKKISPKYKKKVNINLLLNFILKLLTQTVFNVGNYILPKTKNFISSSLIFICYK